MGHPHPPHDPYSQPPTGPYPPQDPYGRQPTGSYPPHNPYGQQPTGPQQPPGYHPQPAAFLPNYGPQPGTSPYGHQQPTPPPPHPPPPPPRRSNLPLILLLAIGLPLVLLGGCTALVFSVGDDTALPARERIEPSAAMTATTEAEATEPPPVDQQAAPQTSQGDPEPVKEQSSAVPVGQPLTLEGLDTALKVKVQVVKVFDPATPDNLFMKPNTGNRFVAVEVTLTNAGQAAYRDSPSIGATLIDTEGRQYRSTFATVREAQGFGGLVSMTGTDTRRGALVFGVPDGIRLAKFQLGLDSGLAPQRGEWLLN